MEPTKQSNRIIVIVIISVIMAGLSGGGVYYFLNQQNEAQENLTNQLQEDDSNTEDKGTEWKTYTSEKYGFSFKYPDKLKVYEDDTSSGEGMKYIIDSVNNIVIKNDTGETAIIININSNAGRGGICARRYVIYDSESKNNEIILSKSSDEYKRFTEPDETYCGREGKKVELNGYEVSVNSFEYNGDSIWIRSNGDQGIDEKNSAEIEQFEQIVETIKFTNKTIDWETYTSDLSTWTIGHPTTRNPIEQAVANVPSSRVTSFSDWVVGERDDITVDRYFELQTKDRIDVKSSNEENIKINGADARRLTVVYERDTGDVISLFIGLKNNGRIYTISGSKEETFEKFYKSFKLVN